MRFIIKGFFYFINARYLYGGDWGEGSLLDEPPTIFEIAFLVCGYLIVIACILGIYAAVGYFIFCVFKTADLSFRIFGSLVICLVVLCQWLHHRGKTIHDELIKERKK